MERLTHELLKQYFYEIESEFTYLHLAGIFANSYKGICNFFIVQAHEEREHAMKFFILLSRMGEQPMLENINIPDLPKTLDVKEALNEGLKHEKFITERINLLVKLATESDNSEILSFLDWFIEEQKEEEEMFEDLITRLGDDQSNLNEIDAELADRVLEYKIISPT